MNWKDFFATDIRFNLFDAQHLGVMIFFGLVGFFYIRYAKNQSEQRQEWLARVGAWSLFVAALGWILLRWGLGVLDTKTDLPFDICNISALAMPFFMQKRNNSAFQILYYWIMTGTTQATLTPNLYEGFPHHTFLKYFWVHCGLIVMIWYAIVVFKMRPTWRGIGTAFVALQVYFVTLICVNTLLASNYAYICHKPDTASLMDYFGPHPYYLVVMELLSLVFFFLYWLPFSRKKANQSVQS